MTPERWQQVKRILETTLEVTPVRREAYLSEACAGDSDLRRELDTLLSAYEGAGSRYDKPFVFSDPSAGRTVGAYRLLRRLGTGGMGEVYLAARADDQFRRLAAIKLIHPEMLEASTRRRFENERHTLAALDHPNIVKLLDGGATDEGAPYLVMEYIEGQPIDQFCSDRSLTIRERLELFRTLCAAVHYAHQNLVVHRDLKPANILVTPQGVPKLMDFGIAKLLRPAYAAATVGFTHTALQPMTPEYASPEQILGRPITTASDIYSLGVLLYLLLSRTHPFRAGAQSAHEMEHGICHSDPAKPSTVAPKEIARSLRGDLDTIVLTAMRKEPQRRYASAEHLAEDVRRYLANEPVLARADSLWYRATKFARRHRIALPASLVAAALVVGLAISDHRDRLLADHRLVQVRGLARSFWDVDQSMRSGATPARVAVATKVLAYLDELAGDAKYDFSLQLERIHGYLKVADLQGNLFRENVGEKDAASKTAGKALAIAEDLERRNPTDARVREALGQCHLSLGDILGPAGSRAEALDHYRKAIEFSRGDVRVTATIWSKVASIEADAGDPAAALETARRFEQAARQWVAANPDDRRGRAILAFARERVAKFALDAGETTPDIEDSVRKAIEQYETGVGSRRNLAMAYKALAEIQQRMGKADEALANCRHSLSISQALLGGDDPRNNQFRIDVAQEMVLLVELLAASHSPDLRPETARAVAFLRPLAHAQDTNLYYVVDYTRILADTSLPEFLDGEDLIAMARRGVSLSADNETLDLLARAYQRAGRIKEAIDAEKRALATLPPRPPAGRPVPLVRRKTEASLTALQAKLPVSPRASR